jgi:hypothetical protein
MRRTTVFLPDELHEQLRHDAHQAKTSMAELIRTKLQAPPVKAKRRNGTLDPILKVAGICKGVALSNNIDDFLYGD